MSDRVDAILGKLYRDENAAVYAVLDGASVPALQQHLNEQEPPYVCLYRGELTPDMAEVAPYLVKLDRDAPFTAWVVEQGWGKHWGVFAESAADLNTLRRHFRGFLTVHDPAGKPLLFRYYDPRVLRVYLPTCNAEELKTMFGPLTAYMMEDENPESLLRFILKNGALAKQVERAAPR